MSENKIYITIGHIEEFLSYDRVNETVDHLRKKGAERFILGCTELPIAYASGKLEILPIDPTLVLARAAVLAAGAELRNP